MTRFRAFMSFKLWQHSPMGIDSTVRPMASIPLQVHVSYATIPQKGGATGNSNKGIYRILPGISKYCLPGIYILYTRYIYIYIYIYILYVSDATQRALIVALSSPYGSSTLVTVHSCPCYGAVIRWNALTFFHGPS